MKNMGYDLMLYQKFILIVQANTLLDALRIAGNNHALQQIVFYLESEYQFYQKSTN